MSASLRVRRMIVGDGRPFLGHRLGRVLEQIQDDLLDLGLVAIHQAQRWDRNRAGWSIRLKSYFFFKS
jgi:hypothetical protein